MKRNLKCLSKAVLFASMAYVAIMLFAGTASAAPVYDGTYVDMYLKKNTFPTGLSEEKVYLDAAVSSTITGHVGSQTGTPLISISSTTDTLDAANGFATIKAQDGYINNITITAPGYYFEDLIFSINLAPNANNNLTITATNYSGATDIAFSNPGQWTSLHDWVNGENDILVLSKSGNAMKSVTIDSVYGFNIGTKKNPVMVDAGVDQLKQIQISGLVEEGEFTPTPTPEPGSLLLLGLGLIGVGAAARKKIKK